MTPPVAVAVAVGGAGLVLGVLTGALSLDQVGDTKDECVNDVCLPAQEDEADSATTLGQLSTVGSSPAERLRWQAWCC